MFIFKNNFLCRFANQVGIGNDVLVEENDMLSPVKVINIFNLKMQGKCHLFGEINLVCYKNNHFKVIVLVNNDICYL